MTWDYPWLSVLVYVAVLEGWLLVTNRYTLTERVRHGHTIVLRLTYLGLAAALYAHFFHGWLG